MIVCAGGNENFKFAKSVGIGLIESSINLSILISKNTNIKEIIFIGTCGIYKNGNILDIYESSHAFNLEYAHLFNDFYTPANYEINLNVSQETFKINSSNYICNDEKASLKFADFGLDFENMEAFSILSVAKKFNIKAKLILCATNFCNKFAHEEFLSNHKFAKEKLCDFLSMKNLI